MISKFRLQGFLLCLINRIYNSALIRPNEGKVSGFNGAAIALKTTKSVWTFWSVNNTRKYATDL